MAREFYEFAPGFEETTAVYRIDDRTHVERFDLDAGAFRPADDELAADVREAIYGNGELTFTKVSAGDAMEATRILQARAKELAAAGVEA